MGNDSIRKSIAENNNLWIALWILAVMNVFALISIRQGFVTAYIIFSVILVAIGIAALKRLAILPVPESDQVYEANEYVTGLMEQLKPMCESIFNSEIERLTEPIIQEIEEDVSKNLVWLWDEGKKYLKQVEEGIVETRAVMQTVSTLDSDKMQIMQKLQENLDFLENFLSNMDASKEKYQQELQQCLANKSQDLRNSMMKEKDFFYDYIEKMLIQQISTTEDELDLSDYVNIEKLEEQFSLVIDKSIQSRIPFFENTVLTELENISADIVGKMQNGALQIMNLFKDMEDLLNRLLDDENGQNSGHLRRLSDSLHRIVYLREKTNETMVTLAWQDILLDKRWLETQQRLFAIRDQVIDNVGEDVVEYLQNSLDFEIPGLSSLRDTSENAVIYKSLLDAEIVYQVYIGENLLDIIGNGVYCLLQFLRPIELMVSSTIRFSEMGVGKRRALRDQMKKSEYQAIWRKVLETLNQNKPGLSAELEEDLPNAFYSFCNSPYIKQKPENLNQAAWMLFMVLINDDKAESEIYLLMGLLLVMHRMRDSYVHPLKNIPLPLRDPEELEYMRYSAFKSMQILLSLELNGMVRTKHR